VNLRHLLLVFALLVTVETKAMNLNDTFNLLTTPVAASNAQQQSLGTAFFYHRLAPPEDPTKKGPQWRAVQDTWLVTNRHVVLPKVGEKEVAPDTFAFHLRKIVDKRLQWEPIVLPRDQLLRRAKFHTDPSVDVSLVKVQDLITDRIAKKDSQYLQYYAVSRENFAGENNIEVQASDDIVVVGYPRGFYDEVNLFPIVKAGIVASRWGAHFGGKPFFLIDAKLFPGSSGSIVVSKPIDIVVRGGQVFHAPEKQFAFLGIYSGEPFREGCTIEAEDLVIKQKLGFNVGIVWYAWLVEDIIERGVDFKP